MSASSQASPEPIVVECDFDKPPATVWRALTVPEFVAAWLGGTDLKPEVGTRFTVEPEAAEHGEVECEILAAAPPNLLRYSWRAGDVDSVVTFELTETERGGTHLRLVQDEFVEVTSAVSRRTAQWRSASLAPARPRRVRRPVTRAAAPICAYRPLRSAA